MAAAAPRPRVLMNASLMPALQAIVESRVEPIFRPDLSLPADGSAADVKAVLTVGHARVTRDVVAAWGGQIRVVSNVGVGIDHIDVKACEDAGLVVGNTPGVLNDATAEMAVALLLAFARHVVTGAAIARDPSVSRFDSGWFGKQVAGSSVGIVGLGGIGREIAARLGAFKARIFYHNRRRASPADETAAAGAGYCASLADLVAHSDFVVLSCPCTAETRGLVSRDLLSRFREGAVLVNIGRGALVDQEAVAEALESGRLGGYATDVTEPEPLPVDHPLRRAPRCLITPHTGSATLDTRSAMVRLALDNLEAGLIDGHPLPARVTAAS